MIYSLHYKARLSLIYGRFYYHNYYCNKMVIAKTSSHTRFTDEMTLHISIIINTYLILFLLKYSRTLFQILVAEGWPV